MLLARSALPVDPLVRCAGCPCSARRPARDAACAAAPPSQFAVQRGPRARAAPTPADIDPLLPEQELPLVLNHHDQPQLPATAAAPASELTGAAAGGYVALDPALGWEEAARATPSDAWTASTDEDLQAAADLLAAGGSGAVDAGACGGQHWWEAAGAAAEGGGGASGAGGSSSPWAAVSAAAAASGIYMGSRSGARSALRLAQDRLLRLAPGGATSRRARRRANALAPPPAQRLYRLAVDEGGNIVRARAVKAEGGPAFMHAHTAALRSAGEGAGVLPPMGRPGLSDGAGAATAATAAAAAAAAAQRLHWRSEAMHLEAMQGASDAKGTSAEGRREAASELPGTTWLPGAGRAAQEVEQQQEEDTSRGDPTRGLQLAAFLYCAGQGAINAALWDLGLPPGCLRYVARVSDADIVLHVMPKRGQKHYQYDTYRQQASAKGIPFVSLRTESATELQAALLPIFRLYSGEATPKEVTHKLRQGQLVRRRRIKL